MNTNKILFSLFAVFLMISCQKDDQELQKIEQLETSNKALRALRPLNPTDNCIYVPIQIRFISGSYSGCELYEKMNEKRNELSLMIDEETGCPIYDIPHIDYFNCDYMDDSFYVENWKILLGYYCGGNYPCTDSAGNPMEPGSDFPLEEDDD